SRLWDGGLPGVGRLDGATVRAVPRPPRGDGHPRASPRRYAPAPAAGRLLPVLASRCRGRAAGGTPGGTPDQAAAVAAGAERGEGGADTGACAGGVLPDHQLRPRHPDGVPEGRRRALAPAPVAAHLRHPAAAAVRPGGCPGRPRPQPRGRNADLRRAEPVAGDQGGGGHRLTTAYWLPPV